MHDIDGVAVVTCVVVVDGGIIIAVDGGISLDVIAQCVFILTDQHSM